MADQHEPDAAAREHESLEVEVVDGELVLVAEDEPETAPAVTRTSAPAVQTAVAAATGFVAGAATLMLLRRYGPGAARAVREAELEQARRREHVHLRRGTYLIHIRPLAPPE